MSEITTPAALLAAINAEHAALLALLPQFTEEQWRAEGRAGGRSPHELPNVPARSGDGLALDGTWRNQAIATAQRRGMDGCRRA